jgi:hypothetical protein
VGNLLPQPLPLGQAPFDLSRQALLSYDFPQLRNVSNPAPGSTTSTVRVRPDQIGPWTTFDQEVLQYCGNISIPDRTALVYWQLSVGQVAGIYTGMEVWNEVGVRQALEILPFSFHQAATQRPNNQPLPSDLHSEITPFQGGWNFEGQPDYVFWSSAQRRITAALDAKKPWTVKPQDITAVLNG